MHLFGVLPPQPSPTPDGWQPAVDPTPALIAIVFLFGIPIFMLLLTGWSQIFDWLNHRERIRRGRRPK